jgi:hypothetical protein
MINETTGIKSYHARPCPHDGQYERGKITLCERTNRYAHTFKKEPQHKKMGTNQITIDFLPLFYQEAALKLTAFQSGYHT